MADRPQLPVEDVAVARPPRIIYVTGGFGLVTLIAYIPFATVPLPALIRFGVGGPLLAAALFCWSIAVLRVNRFIVETAAARRRDFEARAFIPDDDQDGDIVQAAANTLFAPPGLPDVRERSGSGEAVVPRPRRPLAEVPR
jgi:hypothetical protein